MYTRALYAVFIIKIKCAKTTNRKRLGFEVNITLSPNLTKDILAGIQHFFLCFDGYEDIPPKPPLLKCKLALYYLTPTVLFVKC